MTTEKQMAQLVCRALDEKKGRDIKVIDIHDVSVIADYFVIASGSNQNQVQAMVDNVEEQLGRAGFDEENRLFYDLERIWRDGKTLDMEEFLK